MTLDEFIADQKAKIEALRKKNIPLAKAVATTNAKQVNRIFVEGGKSSGSKIGNYNSSDPIYISPKVSPKSFTPKGKTGKSKFLNGKSHKTGFFKSYKDYRQSQGRESSFVNLNLFGIEFSDMANSLTQINPQTWTSGFKNQENVDKKHGQEAKYGIIFDLTKEEIKFYLNLLETETLKVLNA